MPGYYPIDDIKCVSYNLTMIKIIKCKQTKKLRMLHNAETLNDLRIPPSNRLEKLKGNRQEQYSIRINDQWRICFRWYKGDAYEVEIVDYH